MARHAQMVKGQLWVHVDGHTFLYESNEDKKFGRKGSAKAKTNEIAAPMPGKITKILKREGASVVPGDVVLVMEAMKMEFQLAAPLAGVVDTVSVAAGDQVKARQLLVQMVAAA